MSELTITYNGNTDEFAPTWSHYDVVRQLGRGASSIVWLAQDTSSGRAVAIKQFKSDASVPHMEHAILSSLQHRGLPEVYGLFRESERWHIVMEPVIGDTLYVYRRVHGGVLPIEEVRDIGVQLCAVMDELHSNGVLYRDLKPTNVMRETSGRVRLVDFGCACTETEYNNDCYVTPPYAAPEQRVRAETIDHRTDIYSLGVVLFELLTGRTDFEMQPFEDVNMEQLRSVCLSMIAQDASKRPQSMVDVMLSLLKG
jgi:serine/threonine protein kinase